MSGITLYPVITLNKKTINKFAILVILMIVVPEAVGHTLFEKSHSADSSVAADVSMTNNLHDNAGKIGICHLYIQSDSSGYNIARAAGLEGKYGNYTCV
ncbi:MAG: hypothetical protein KGH99_04985 [Thaumarchaeota archaeon]|nr:hypothetical protein [Nitrososphaerota archaeon]